MGWENQGWTKVFWLCSILWYHYFFTRLTHNLIVLPISLFLSAPIVNATLKRIEGKLKNPTNDELKLGFCFNVNIFLHDFIASSALHFIFFNDY